MDHVVNKKWWVRFKVNGHWPKHLDEGVLTKSEIEIRKMRKGGTAG